LRRFYDKENLSFREKRTYESSISEMRVRFFECVWFRNKYIYDVFPNGDFFAVSGKNLRFLIHNIQFTHPDFNRITTEESNNFLILAKLILFYRVPKN